MCSISAVDKVNAEEIEAEPFCLFFFFPLPVINDIY